MRHLTILAAVVLAASTASAQTAPAPAGGPLVLERIHDGWVLAPDFKVTRFDDRTGQLAGAYGGRVIESTVLVGGAGYWLANGERDFKLGYGGLVVGLQSPEFGIVRFDGRALVGGGRATLGFDVSPLQATQRTGGAPLGDIRFGSTAPGGRGTATGPSIAPAPGRTFRIVGRDDFFVFEPQAGISARFAKGVGMSCGVSYRATAGTDVLRNRLNGPSANVAVQSGW